jgi:recombination protein RecR
MNLNLFPETIKKVVDNLSKLPGIGKKTAFRLTFFMLNADEKYVFSLTESIENLKKNIRFCKNCFNFSTGELCDICLNKKRDFSQICVVESVVDLYNIEKSAEFNGVYHVLHGAISPIDGILPDNLKIKELIEKLKKVKIRELILAMNPTSEGNATASYIIQQLKKNNLTHINISRIASGIPVGSEIEYIDQLTLSEAIKNRREIKDI